MGVISTGPLRRRRKAVIGQESAHWLFRFALELAGAESLLRRLKPYSIRLGTVIVLTFYRPETAPMSQIR